MNSSSAMPLVSVCVPTYKRKSMLAIALASILEQTYESIEIIIGDDSPDNESEAFVKTLIATTSREIRYTLNRPGLGQNANVHRLLQSARGEYIVLLHDDDALLPHNVETLIGPMLADPSLQLVYGKQAIIDQNGTRKPSETIAYNTKYIRTAKYAGRQICPLDSALRGQIPNNGFVVRAQLAKKIGYRSELEVGVFCDLDFNIRLAQEVPVNSLLYVDEFVSLYRETSGAISRSARSHLIDHPEAGLKMYLQVSAIPDTPEISEARNLQLTRQSDKAFKCLAFRHDRLSALKIFFSPYYPMKRRLSAFGVYHLSLLVFPQLERIRRAKEL